MDKNVETNLVYTILGVILGYISFIITNVTNTPELNILVLIAVLFSSKYILQKSLKIDQKWSWWFSNGIILCVFLWLVIWTLFYNLA